MTGRAQVVGHGKGEGMGSRAVLRLTKGLEEIKLPKFAFLKNYTHTIQIFFLKEVNKTLQEISKMDIRLCIVA